MALNIRCGLNLRSALFPLQLEPTWTYIGPRCLESGVVAIGNEVGGGGAESLRPRVIAFIYIYGIYRTPFEDFSKTNYERAIIFLT